ncbi:hypothetical protein CHH48_13575 [Terribacillus saccharophilus]|uniref:Uncharacterized protein n=1 Tax=Terribacillus saccharophilus TaxID=361277 RepID=A0ABX4GWE5_9BACI|nr:hypothetical protein CHH56_12445 [Terribacillus saccharophilus]PAD95614.1 hypothetical protein CHH50_12680 [Terribacillus saccharophilus]PAD99192.1 hypothetical protein CHH48_13575 [Terribacillus saccharophilus]
MKRSISILSALIFLVSTCITYFSLFETNSQLPVAIIIIFAWVLPLIGLIMGAAGGKTLFKYIGFYGNLLLLLVTVLYPVVISFIWNQP